MGQGTLRRRFVVRGVVQGVGFRWATRVEASRLGLAGYARNLADGASVEIEAEGSAAELELLRAWLEAGGPPSARVSSVDVVDVGGVSAGAEPRGEVSFTVE